ncbi:MAG: peptide antibiotic transporter SbmA [Bdellovibrionales bacterium]|nr:peptide antibiotic transporter SbmA [Bdellovibrionales bacterium]
MFISFFPYPRIFFTSFLVWCSILVGVWYKLGDDLGRFLGFQIPLKEEQVIFGLSFFFSQKFLWFYLFYFTATVLFYFFWKVISRRNKWLVWSILGSSLIIFLTWFSVQFMVAYNNWLRPFFDMIQDALSGKRTVEVMEIYTLLFSIFGVFAIGAIVFVFNRFFTSHYIFRWRTAMNDYYIFQWSQIRTIEGASQRVQEDAMKFSSIMQGLGTSMMDSIMTLFAFLPVMIELSVHVKELPIVGAIPAPLLFASIGWSLFGTLLLIIVGIKLPGLEFENQKVEAAYRKELVYGEDDKKRAGLKILQLLYNDVRANYFRLYFHYAYSNVARISYIYADYIFVLFIMAPTIAAGGITFGIFTQIRMALFQVSNSFQYLVNSWTTIIDLLSVHKRLAHFEEAIKNQNRNKSIPPA